MSCIQSALQNEFAANARLRLQFLKSWQMHLEWQSLPPPKQKAKKYLFAYFILKNWKPKPREGKH